MRVLVFEYVTGGGMAGADLPPSLCREADLMLAALVADLADLPGIEVITTRDARLRAHGLRAAVHYVHQREAFWQRLEELMASTDAVWPIAPESGGVLEDLTTWLQARGIPVLNSSADAIRLTASKLATSRCLAARGIPVVPTFRAEDEVPAVGGRWVVKPDDGAGCEDTWLLPDGDRVRRCAPAGAQPARVVQPFVHGIPASLCLLAGRDGVRLLSVNRQHMLIEGGRFRLCGCTVNVQLDERPRLCRLAEDIFAAVAGLRGAVGVDFILTDDGPVVLEVNPRLTTSYAGLREALGINPAALVLQALCGLALPERASSASRSVRVDLEAFHAA